MGRIWQLTMLVGKRIIVTGASSGIGSAIASVFAQYGGKVAASGRNAAGLDALGTAASVKCIGDLTEPGTAERVVTEAVETLGGIDILVNSAGVLQGSPIQDTSLAVWHHNFAANTHVVFEMMHYALPHMKEGGAVCTISSVNGLQAFGGT